MTPPGTPLVTNVLENEPIENGGYISAQKGLPNLVKSLTMIKTNRVSFKCLGKIETTEILKVHKA
jgi:hypothetical protein